VERFQSANELLQQLETRSTVAPTQLHHRFTQNDASARNSSPTLANNSGQGHLFDDSVKVPREIQGWNWGAFFLPGVWCITNQVWIGLISWTDFSLITLPLTLGMTWPIMAVILGIKGNEWAWKSRRWNSVKDFKRHQRLWAFVGFLLIAALLLLVALIVFMIVALGMSSMGTGNMGGMGGTRD